MSATKGGHKSCSVWPLMHPAVAVLFGALSMVATVALMRGPERLKIDCERAPDGAVACSHARVFLSTSSAVVRTPGAFVGAHSEAQGRRGFDVVLEGSGGPARLGPFASAHEANAVVTELRELEKAGGRFSLEFRGWGRPLLVAFVSLLLGCVAFFVFGLKTTLTIDRSRNELRFWTRRWPLAGVRDAVALERVADVVMHERADVVQGKPRVQRSIALELSDNTRLRLIDVWFSGEGYRAAERLRAFLR